MEANPSCKLEDKNKSCCAKSTAIDQTLELKSHWNQAYRKNPENKLGWFETDFSPSFRLLDQCQLNLTNPCLLVGSGSSRLPDELIKKGVKQLWVTDISEVAIQEVQDRLDEKLNYRVGDILEENTLEGIEEIQLWFDRAVLHFFTDKEDQEIYFNILKKKVKKGGFVILAEFNLSGSEKCSGLTVFRYNEKMYQERLGDEFILLDAFDHTYIMPSEAERQYSYALFQRKK